MNCFLNHLFKVSIIIWIFLFGFEHVVCQLLQDVMPNIIVTVIGTVLTLYCLRIKPPPNKQVEDVLGRDPLCLCEEDSENVIRTIAHRGARYDCPENTLESFRMCAEKGIMAVEIDLQLTADNVCVIFHDETLERMTGDVRCIRECKYSELKKVDLSVKHPHGDKFKHTKIPTLREAIDQCLKDGQNIIFDIKDSSETMIEIVLGEYDRNPNLICHSICSSFYPNIIYKLRKRNPNILGCLAWRPYVYSYDNYTSALNNRGTPKSSFFLLQLYYYLKETMIDLAIHQVLFYMLGLSAILLHKDTISAEQIYNWHCRGIRVIAWTVNHPVEKQQFSRVFKISYLTDTLIGETNQLKNKNRNSDTK